MSYPNLFKCLAISAAFFSSIVISADYFEQPPKSAEDWYQQGESWLQSRLQQSNESKIVKAKNIILFVGDGMSITTLTAARILAGQQQESTGEENFLSFEKFPHSALVKTYNVNQQTPDSAGTMSAIMTGLKTRAGVISLGAEQVRAVCAGSEKNKKQTLIEWAHQQDYATGVVTTARVTHATPAATYAHSAERNWELDSWKYPEAHLNGCTDIAKQLLTDGFDNGLDLILGGGRRNFYPWYSGGSRLLPIIGEWEERNPNAALLKTREQLENLDMNRHPILGLFSESHMSYSAQRKKVEKEPSLTEMTKSAIQYLKIQSSKGFILVIEGARIDHGHHAGNASLALQDTIEMANAVELADKLTDDSDTLIVVTADHSHTLSMSGYPARGNPILGVVKNQKGELILADDDKPYTTLGYSNGKGAYHHDNDEFTSESSERKVGRNQIILENDVHDHSYHQEALVPLSQETHGSDDVALHAKGPGAERFRGLIEQNTIYHLLKRSLVSENVAPSKEIK